MSRHTYRLHRLFTIVLVVQVLKRQFEIFEIALFQLLIPFAIVGAPNFVTVTLLQARIQNVTRWSPGVLSKIPFQPSSSSICA